MAYAPLRSGDLNRQVDIEIEERTPNGAGGFTTIWTPIAREVWAAMIPLRGDEALSLGVQRSSQLWKITIRYRADVTVKHRLRHRDQVLEIKTAVDPFGRRDRIVMTAEGRAA